MSQPRRLRTQSWAPRRMGARKRSHFGRNDRPGPTRSGPGLASIGSGRRTRPRIDPPFRRECEILERNLDGMMSVSVSDDRGVGIHANEPCTLLFVHHGLVRLKGARRPELHLQELGARDGIQPKRVHAPEVRRNP